MASVRASSWLISTLLFAVGCSDASTPAPAVDSGITADAGATDAPAADVPPADAGRPLRSPQPLYGPCDSAAECRDGLTCRRAADSGYPGGQCNVECTRDDDCVIFAGGKPVDGFCQPADHDGHRLCARVCANGIDCEREGYTCIGTTNPGTIGTVNICVPVCTDDSCIDGTVCDHETGRCHLSTTPTPVGRTVGQSCVAATDPTMTPATICRSGFCSVEITHDSMGVPFETGFNGGSCYARCILPSGYNSSNLWAGTTLPQSNCSDNAICFPASTLAEGDPGICLQACTADTDCRASEGYTCRKSYVLSNHTYRFMNGYCTPYDCAAAGAHACPTGLMCRRTTSGTTTTGRCIPQTGM